MVKKYLLLLLIIILTRPPHVHAQAVTPDFRSQLAKATTDSQKLTIYRSAYDHYNSTANDSSMPYVEEGLRSFTQSGYKHGQAFMLILMSNILSERGETALAKEKGEEALAIFTSLNEEQDIAKAHTNIGNACSYMGNYAEAVKHFLLSLKGFEHVADTPGLINTYLELGSANDYNGEHDKALAYYQTALGLSAQRKPAAYSVYLYNNVGLYHARKGEFDTALYYFEKAEQIGRDPKLIKARVSPLINIGRVYEAKGDHKQALEYFYEALAISKELKVKDRIAKVLLEIGQIEGWETPPNVSALQEGLQIAKEMDSKRLQADFLTALAGVADHTGDYKEEVALLKHAQVLKDSVFNINKAKEIANLQAEYDLKRTSKQLAALEHSERSNAHKKNIIIVIAIVLAVTLLTLLIFYTRSRRLNRELSDLNKELFAHEQELKHANAMKDRLFSIIGHDLKGPIGNIPSLLSIYKDEQSSDEEKEFIMRSMEESSQASLDTLEKLLTWGKQQIKGDMFSPTVLDVDEIMLHKLRLLGAAAANKKVTIVNNIPAATRIYADENQFKFIMRNLIANAVKFTHEGGRVEVSATQHTGDNLLTFSVKDNGVGMDEETQQYIFDPYNKSTSGTANEAGTSIGLMLCKEFVIQNGGKIWVESIKDQGSVFSFTVIGDRGGN